MEGCWSWKYHLEQALVTEDVRSQVEELNSILSDVGPKFKNEDKFIWFRNPEGKYMVREGYAARMKA